MPGQSRKIPRPLSRYEVRDIDRRAIEEYGVPSIVLMENAGRGTVETLIGLGANGPFIVCAGKGNNAGDGFVIARHLENRGCDVSVLLFCRPEELKGDAAVNYRILERAQMPLRSFPDVADAAQLDQELQSAEWIVDALLGTGTQGEIRQPFVSAIDAINRAGRRVLAVDLPSGLDCDTGRPLGPCVRADHTATFVARKIGFDAPGAAAWTGEIHVIDIGVPRRLLESL